MERETRPPDPVSAQSRPVSPVKRLRDVAREQESWGVIEVPRLGLRAFLAEGADAKTLRVAAGHIPRTAFPDEPGNVAVAAHRDTHFRPLRELVSGDVVKVSTPSGVFEYEVNSIEVVEPSRIDKVGPRPGHVLTLVTCYPFNYIGAAPRRFIAQARLIRAPASVASTFE